MPFKRKCNQQFQEELILFQGNLLIILKKNKSATLLINFLQSSEAMIRERERESERERKKI